MHVVIFVGGTLHPGKAVNRAIATADRIIAADSGAATALLYGCVTNIVVGDFDSLAPQTLQELEQHGSQLRRAAIEKNETDTELAIQVALEQGATTITILGGTGGPRLDHAIANILLLTGYDTIPIRIIDGPSICWLLRGPGSTTIEGRQGDLLSLFPLHGDATGTQTHGLYYPLRNETLYAGKPRGVSNMLTGTHAEVSLQSGMLLVIHTDEQELLGQIASPVEAI